MTALERPDPNTVSHEIVAEVARRRHATLADDLLLRDAQMQELRRYAAALEARLAELEGAPPAG